jgi:WD40 repeat protein
VLRAARDHPDNINILRVSNHGCGRTVVSASAKTMKVWHLDGARRPIDIKPGKGGILDVALSTDGNQIVFASRLENASVWSAQTGECLQTIPDTGFAVSFSPNGNRIAMLTSSRTLRLWDLARRRFVRTPDQPRTAMQSGQFGVGAVTFASESRLAASQDRTIFIWDQKRLYWGQSLVDDDTAKSLLFSSDNRRLAASYDDKIKIWDVAGSCCLQMLNTAAIPHHLNLVAFDTARSQLLTEVGIIDLGDPDEPLAEAGGAGREFRCQGYGVHAGVDGGWVSWNSRKMLWLPPAYYPDRSAVMLPEPGASTPSAIVLGCRSGRVVILQVGQDHLPKSS